MTHRRKGKILFISETDVTVKLHPKSRPGSEIIGAARRHHVRASPLLYYRR